MQLTSRNKGTKPASTAAIEATSGRDGLVTFPKPGGRVSLAVVGRYGDDVAHVVLGLVPAEKNPEEPPLVALLDVERHEIAPGEMVGWRAHVRRPHDGSGLAPAAGTTLLLALRTRAGTPTSGDPQGEARRCRDLHR